MNERSEMSPNIEVTMKKEGEKQDPFFGWKNEIEKIEKSSTIRDEMREKKRPRQIGSERDFVIVKNDETILNAKEFISYDGQSYEIDVMLDGKNIGRLRYQAGAGSLNMGRTDVASEFQELGINARLFKDMTDLHPEATSVWTKLDGTNTKIYLDALQNGDDPITAARKTPAGKVREKTGWEIDPTLSSLPNWIKGQGFINGVGQKYFGAIRLVYKKSPQIQ